MGEMAIPPQKEREQTLALASEIKRAVEDDLEGPLALPDPQGVWGARSRSELLKKWWIETDTAISRLAQDLLDNRAALEIACALLAARDAELGRTSFAHRLRMLDIPTQEELDGGTSAPEPTADPAA